MYALWYPLLLYAFRNISKSMDNYFESLNLKEEGNQLFKNKDFVAAIEKYVRASVLLVQGGAPSDRVKELQLLLHLNLALLRCPQIMGQSADTL